MRRRTGRPRGSWVYCKESKRRGNARGGLCENDVGLERAKHQYLALLLNQVEVRLKTKLNSSLWPYAIVTSSSSSMTERALLAINPKALSSLGFANLCCSANLKHNTASSSTPVRSRCLNKEKNEPEKILTCGNCDHPVSRRCSSFADKCHLIRSCAHTQTYSWPCCWIWRKDAPIVWQHSTKH